MSRETAIYPCKIYNKISVKPSGIYHLHKKRILCGYRRKDISRKKRAARIIPHGSLSREGHHDIIMNQNS